jgi:hypothetical protein
MTTDNPSPFKILARERNARRLADVMWQAIVALGCEPEDILLDSSAETRRRAEKAAGVNPGRSRETWLLVVQFLKERQAIEKEIGK